MSSETPGRIEWEYQSNAPNGAWTVQLREDGSLAIIVCRDHGIGDPSTPSLHGHLLPEDAVRRMVDTYISLFLK